MLLLKGTTIQIERAEWVDLRREAKRRVTLHKRSMQREADLKEQLRSTRQEVRELRADSEEKDGEIERLRARNEWLEKQVFGRSTGTG